MKKSGHIASETTLKSEALLKEAKLLNTVPDCLVAPLLPRQKPREKRNLYRLKDFLTKQQRFNNAVATVDITKHRMRKEYDELFTRTGKG